MVVENIKGTTVVNLYHYVRSNSAAAQMCVLVPPIKQLHVRQPKQPEQFGTKAKQIGQDVIQKKGYTKR